MNKSLGLLFILTLIFSCKKQIEITQINYNDIENGLQPAVVVGDSLSQTYTVKDAMAKYNVPAVSMVAFEEGEIVWTKYYGNKRSESNDAIDENTKFQAASIGKAVTALGVLKLVEKHGLDLDADVNKYLLSWKADGEFTKTQKVTIRQLLNHTSGTNVGGFHGYSKTGTIPSLLEIVDGKGDSPKIEIKTVPGSSFSYSGGGFAILQLLVEDVSGKTFETFFQEEVFGPLKMNNSTFDQFPKENVALAHDKQGKTHPDGWLIYPELSAAGLWSTPTDLAKFCMALEDCYFGRANSLISKELADQMLTVTKNWGLGIGIRGEDDDTYFFHGGGNPGSYKSLIFNIYKKGTGMVIMTNAGQGNKLHDDVLRSFSSFYESTIFKPKYVNPIELDAKQIAALCGKYHFEKMGEYFLEIITDASNRIVLYDPNDESKVTFVPISETEFIDVESGNKSSFVIDPKTRKVEEMNYSGAYIFKKIDK